MFKALMVLILVSLTFPLYFSYGGSTSSCYYRLSGSTWFNKDTTLNYVDADNKVQSVHLVWGDIKLIPNMNSSIVRGSVYQYSDPKDGFVLDGRKLLRVSYYMKSWQTINCPTIYTTFDMKTGLSITKTCTTSTNKLYWLEGIVPGTTITIKYYDEIHTSDPITTEGAVLSLSNTSITQTPGAYFYIKNSTNSVKTVSYTSIQYDNNYNNVTDSILCPANSVTEVTYGISGTSVWIGSVKYDNVQLGDKIVLNDGNAVETANISKASSFVIANPSIGSISISLAVKGDVMVHSIDGKLISNYKNVNSVKTESLKSGIYIVSTKLGNIEQRRMITVVK